MAEAGGARGRAALLLAHPDFQTKCHPCSNSTECQPLTKNCVSRVGVIQKLRGQDGGGEVAGLGMVSKNVDYCPRSG